MGFKSVKNDGGMMKPGDYEVFVKECGYSVTKNGNDCIKFDLGHIVTNLQSNENKHESSCKFLLC